MAFAALRAVSQPRSRAVWGATPPEDCGGAPGYEDFVQAMADVNHPEHAEMAQWVGRDTWNPNAFDTIDVNDWLGSIKV